MTFKVGDKVIYHGAGTKQTLDNMGAIGTVTKEPHSTRDEREGRESMVNVKWDTGPYNRGEISWYTSNLDLYEEDDE